MTSATASCWRAWEFYRWSESRGGDFEADVAIVGAGSGACVLANRLSEDSRVQVLILEAGERDRSFLADVPGLTMRLMGNPQTDWCHIAEPDPTLNGRALVWHAGKMLGGGSGINGLVD